MSLSVVSDRPATLSPGDRWLKVTDVMSRTSLSRSTIYGLMDSGRLKSVKVLGARRIAESALAEFMASFDGAGDITSKE